MKKYIYLIAIVSSSMVQAQVGINTTKPQAKLHIDGVSDNSKTGAPTSTQIKNDVAIIANGNLGSGTIAPTNKVELRHDTPGAVKIVDGTQGEGKILVSDNNGVGTWQLPNKIKPIIPGIFEKGSSGGLEVNSTGADGGYRYSNVHIKLTKGVWLVNLGLTLQSFIKSGTGKWVHIRLSSSPTSQSYTGWANLGTAGNNTAIAGSIYGSAMYTGTPTKVYWRASGNNFISGTNLIEVTANEVELYVLIETFQDIPSGYSGVTHLYSDLNFTLPNEGKVWVFNTGNWENYLYANPL